MQKGKIVENILGKRLVPYGFVYDGYSQRMWQLKKVLKNGVEQYVIVYKSGYDNSLRLGLCTSVHRGHLFINDITDDPKYSTQFISYTDDEDFAAILDLFADFVLESGLKKLDEISKPLFRFDPDENMHSYLFNNHPALANSFAEKNKIAADSPLENSFAIIEAIMANNEKEKDFDDEAKLVLMEATAFFANKIISRHGGNWEWQDPYKRCCLNHVNGKFFQYDFLKWFVNAWEKADAGQIIRYYNAFIKAAAPLGSGH